MQLGSVIRRDNKDLSRASPRWRPARSVRGPSSCHPDRSSPSRTPTGRWLRWSTWSSSKKFEDSATAIRPNQLPCSTEPARKPGSNCRRPTRKLDGWRWLARTQGWTGGSAFLGAPIGSDSTQERKRARGGGYQPSSYALTIDFPRKRD
jgi:hypothetical protein